MKKKILILGIIIILITTIYIYISTSSSNNFNIRTIESINCSYKPELYFETKSFNIYTYCIDDISVIDSRITSLKDKLDNNQNFINKILNKLSYEIVYDTASSKIYKDYKTEKLTNNGITIIKCGGKNNITNDIYIGPDSMEYKSNFCLKDNSTFVKTYKVTDATEYFSYVELTLSDDISTYRTTLNTNYKFEEGNIYDFEFKKEKENNNTIKSIIENSTLVEIRKEENK